MRTRGEGNSTSVNSFDMRGAWSYVWLANKLPVSPLYMQCDFMAVSKTFGYYHIGARVLSLQVYITVLLLFVHMDGLSREY